MSRDAIAKMIYQRVFLPGEDVDHGGPMPPWEEAVKHDIGAVERCQLAADDVTRYIIDQQKRK